MNLMSNFQWENKAKGWSNFSTKASKKKINKSTLLGMHRIGNSSKVQTSLWSTTGWVQNTLR